MQKEYAVQMASSNLRFGAGVTKEVGMDLADMGLRRVLVLTDKNLKDLPPVQTTLASLQSEKIEYDLYDNVRVEPTDVSMKEAIDIAVAGKYEGYVAVGGGSVIDTAKAANLYATYPDDFYAYINAPIGLGKPVPGPVKPLIAIPTTAGTGSETTGVAIMDLTERNTKSGIAHRFLKPTLGLVDSENTRGMPQVIAACSGLDVLCHALESYTAIPYLERPRPARPINRPAYQGSNPISDIWALRAIALTSKYLVRAVSDANDDEARSNMILAASMAGMGFGNAGVHLCHGMSYPVSGMVRNYKPEGLNLDHAIIPHGMSVILNAPAVFRFTGPACPERHLTVAELMGANISNVVSPEDEAGEILADQIVRLMKELSIPNGLSAVGYIEDDIPALVAGTLPQHRVTKLSPREASPDDLRAMFQDAMVAWD
ncbi:MAG: iron-containing alcohol dehydrogenase [Cyclobacteriaceae bacterium]|nr:iron-containing alcohol dehydrogenase [Cyclobacteriaceae bacterium]MDH5250950.1 iron-containing alcohol dehydrogenase [Cyclobacteriaceae bacterium]